MRAARFALRVAAFLAVGAAAAAQSVVINEIHYNPPGSGDPQEFVELYNPGAMAVDISGWNLRGFATPGCIFAPGTLIDAGGFIVAAKDPAALQAATGFLTVHTWGANDSLNNDGEVVELHNAADALVDTVTYSPLAPWPTELSGRSLELINPALDNSDPGAWGGSAALHGTPGAINSVFTAGPIISHETPTRMTAVSSLSAVTIVFTAEVTGVDASDLLVAGSPAGAVVPAAGPASSYTFTGFAPPPSGSVAITVLPGGIQAGAVGFAGDGWTLSVGQVLVINEIHYHPPDAVADAEFIELHNPGSSAVGLDGWRITDGVELDFAPGASVPAGGYLVVALNPTLLQQTTGYGGAVAWSSGRLDNGGERVAIADASNNLIDEVAYVDKGTWPTAPDGDGRSLELLNPLLLNEHGASWRASNADHGTPGAVNSIYQASVAPIIVNAKHEPVVPAPLENVTVTAFVFDDNPSPSVTLYYREDQDPTIAYTSLAMLDDGLHGDGAVGDGVYGAVMPGLADGQRLDFTIRASDGVNSGAAPVGHNTLVAGQYPAQTYLCPFVAAQPAADFPGYFMVTTQRVRNQQNSINENEYDATFIRRRADGTLELFYNVLQHYRGASSLNQEPHSFHIKFSEDRALQSEMGFTVTRLILNAQSVVKQHLGTKMFRESFGGAVPAPYTQFVRFHTSPLTRGGVQDYIYINVERLDDGFLTSQDGDIPQPLRFPDLCSDTAEPCTVDGDCGPGESCVPIDEGNLYRGRHNDSHLRWEGSDPAAYMVDGGGQNGYELENNEDGHDWTDLLSLCYALDAATTPDNSVGQDAFEAAVAPLVDEEEWARWFALHMLLVNWEGGLYLSTGDDYYLFFRPTGAPGGYSATLLPWDLDSTFGGFLHSFDTPGYTIWSTNVASPRRFLQSNAFAGRFVKAVDELLNTTFLQANIDAWIDAVPDAVLAQHGHTRAQFKNWVAARRTFVNNEIKRTFTLSGVPSSPYTSTNPVLSLSGLVPQVGTRKVLINGQTVIAYSVRSAVWSHEYTLQRGTNQIVVQCVDYLGNEIARQTATVRYDPPPASVRVTAPSRMLNSNTLTLKAEALDALGEVDWRIWNKLGSVSAVRVSDGTPVPTSITVFETLAEGYGGGVPPADSIRFYNGVGSVSITLDGGAAVAAGDIRVTVTLAGVSANKVVTVLDAAQPGLFDTLSGTLAGEDLIWEPADGVIHLTGDVTVPAGQTLSILPGTLIMANAGPSGNGVDIFASNSNVSAIGTQADPIYFFAANGPAAMVLPQDAQNNPPSWGGIDLSSSGTSTLAYVFLVGAGNNSVSGHPRPPVVHLSGGHNVVATDSVFADCPGKIIHGGGNGDYTIQRCLLSRCGIGGEFIGSGYVVNIEDTWFTRIGRAPEPNGVDGDVLHIDRDGNIANIRRCIMTDCGDDMIDHSTNAQPVIENCIIYDARDKTVSLDTSPNGRITMINCLIFHNPGGIRCNGKPAFLTHCTLGTSALISGQSAGSVIQSCIFWPNSANTCTGDVDYTLVGVPGDAGCGTGNFSLDPLFLDNSYADRDADYDLALDSPALHAGPVGNRIGWLGFPVAETCLVDSDCDDNNECTTDVCMAGVCDHTAVGGCCNIDSECDDGLYCNGLETCNVDHYCDPGTPVDCGGDVCDEVSDTCVECVAAADCDDGDACTSDTCTDHVCGHEPVSCDDGNPCTDDACDSLLGCVHVNNASACDDGVACTSDDTCSNGVCVGVDDCPLGQACDHVSGVCVFEPQTLTFRDGVGGYAGTVDTYINLNEPAADHGALDTLRWDTQESSGTTPMYTLIRFENLFEGYGGPIPVGAQILTATLSYTVGGDNATGDPGDLREALVSWGESATYNTFGGDAGVQSDEYGGVSIATLTATQATTHTVSVLPSVLAWSLDPAMNNGWIVVPTAVDGVRVRSSEFATQADRPMLTVTYVGGCTIDSECDDSNACTDDRCISNACQHLPVVCDDGQYCDGAEVCDTVLGCVESASVPCGAGQACDEVLDVCVNAPVVEAIGGRYLEVTPAAGASAVALEVSSAAVPCLPRYVDSGGRLVDTPVFHTAAEWGVVQVADEEVIPSALYAVRVGVGSPPAWTSSVSATTWLWGDAGGDGNVDVLDIICVLDGFQSAFGLCTLSGDDLAGDVPDGIIDLFDINAALDAFSGDPYPDSNPCVARVPANVAGQVTLAIVPSREVIGPNDRVALDVFAVAASDLRGIQLGPALWISNGVNAGVGGRLRIGQAPSDTPLSNVLNGGLTLDSLHIDVARPDYVFAGLTDFSAVDRIQKRLAAAALEGGVEVSKPGYVGTFVMRARNAAPGKYRLGFRSDDTMALDSAGMPLRVELLPVWITVASH